MKKTHPNTTTSAVAQFISRRIYELRARRTQVEIATAAGFKSAGMLSMVKDGKAKLPLERVISLAKALECDPQHLVRLALEQTLSQPVLDQIFAGVNGPTSANERAILARVRDLSSNTDPSLTPERDLLLAEGFSGTGKQVPAQVTASIANYVSATALALLIEANAAQRCVRR